MRVVILSTASIAPVRWRIYFIIDIFTLYFYYLYAFYASMISVFSFRMPAVTFAFTESLSGGKLMSASIMLRNARLWIVFRNATAECFYSLLQQNNNPDEIVRLISIVNITLLYAKSNCESLLVMFSMRLFELSLVSNSGLTVFVIFTEKFSFRYHYSDKYNAFCISFETFSGNFPSITIIKLSAKFCVNIPRSFKVNRVIDNNGP